MSVTGTERHSLKYFEIHAFYVVLLNSRISQEPLNQMDLGVLELVDYSCMTIV
jgi:hypothetical protein